MLVWGIIKYKAGSIVLDTIEPFGIKAKIDKSIKSENDSLTYLFEFFSSNESFFGAKRKVL